MDYSRQLSHNPLLMRIQRRSLEARIEKIKDDIAALGDVHPGALSRQFNICGNPRCRCKADPPTKHGPYYQVSYTWHRKSTSLFIRQENVDEVKKQLRNYHRLRKLVDRWVTLAIELAHLRRQQQRQARKNIAKTMAKTRVPQEK
ncbi:MAG: DUF6788 family protein [Pseudomonadota bacterium]